MKDIQKNAISLPASCFRKQEPTNQKLSQEFWIHVKEKEELFTQGARNTGGKGKSLKRRTEVSCAG